MAGLYLKSSLGGRVALSGLCEGRIETTCFKVSLYLHVSGGLDTADKPRLLDHQ